MQYFIQLISVVKQNSYFFFSHSQCLHIFHPICGHFFIPLMSAFKFIIANHGNVNKFVCTVINYYLGWKVYIVWYIVNIVVCWLFLLLFNLPVVGLFNLSVSSAIGPRVRTFQERSTQFLILPACFHLLWRGYGDWTYRRPASSNVLQIVYYTHKKDLHL